jgi:hypothetical protein
MGGLCSSAELRPLRVAALRLTADWTRPYMLLVAGTFDLEKNKNFPINRFVPYRPGALRASLFAASLSQHPSVHLFRKYPSPALCDYGL